MSTNILHSPATIIQQYLRSEYFGTAPELDDSWPIFVGFMPNEENATDNAICVYDTAGISDGRSMKSGKIFMHEGINIKVRAIEYDTGYRKARDIFEHLGTVSQEEVLVSATLYTIIAFTMTTSIVPLGESEVRRRKSFSINGLVSILAEQEE